MLKKYEFTNYEEFATLYNSIGEEDIVQSSYDEEGNLIPTILVEKTSHKPIFVFSDIDKYCVDIYWKNTEDSSLFDSYEVFPKEPKHEIA